jgi:homoserine O-acetyltransferase
MRLSTWQSGDINANPRYGHDIAVALDAIKAKAIRIPCTTDLYFPPRDIDIEATHMPNVEVRPYDSPWGHCVASPGNDPGFAAFLDDCIRRSLAG